MSKRLKSFPTMEKKGKGKKKVGESSSQRRNPPPPRIPSPPPAPVHQELIFSTNKQRKRYDRLITLEPHQNRKFDWDLLRNVGLDAPIIECINQMEWTQFVSLDPPAILSIALEFLSSIKRPDDTHIRYRLFNRNRSVSLETLSELFHLRCGGTANISPTFDPQLFWCCLTHSTDHFIGGKSKASKIISPKMNLFHRLLTHTLHFRVESNDTVQKEDLYVMWCFVTNFQFDNMTWFIERVIRLAERAKKNLSGCGYITFMAIGHLPPGEINLGAFQTLPVHPSDTVGVISLIGLKLIKKQGQTADGHTIWVSTVPRDAENGAILTVAEAHQFMTSGSLKRKEVAPADSSSDDDENASSSSFPAGGDPSSDHPASSAHSLDDIYSRLQALELTQTDHFERFKVFDQRHATMETMISQMHAHMFPPPPPTAP